MNGKKIKPTANAPSFPKLFEMPIATRIAMTIFTIGMKNNKSHHHGFPAIVTKR
jgi:hypothetical protein